MSMSRLAQVQSLFEATIQLAPQERRDFVLRSTDEPEVRADVLELLEHDDPTSNFLDQPALSTFPAVVNHACSQIGEFRILSELGRGSMGIVYHAKDTMLRREVALKVLGCHLTGSRTGIERFRREAQAAAKLNHSAIVPVYSCGEDRGTHYIAMELVRGETLDHHLGLDRSRETSPVEAVAPKKKPSKKQFSCTESTGTSPTDYARECARIAAHVAHGLDYAHREDILHRDVKPSNILIDATGQSRLTDFGIASMDDGEKLTRSGDVAGTFRYMSPEQISSKPLDGRTDIFSLGVVLYEMLTRVPPFQGDGLSAIADAIREDDPVPVKMRNPSVHCDLETICHKTLEKDPNDRYPTAAHLAADLDSFLRGEPIMARPPSIFRKMGRWLKRRKSLGIAAALMLVLGALGVAWGQHLQEQWNSMASITIQVPHIEPAPRVAVRSWDHNLQNFTAAQDLGPVPIVDRLFQPGSYRFIVFDETNRFIEFDEVLVAGSKAQRSLAMSAIEDSVEDMLLFEAGEYTIRPARTGAGGEDLTVHLEGFYLDDSMVSNAQYQAFIQDSNHPPPRHWEVYGYDKALDDRPIVGVSWADAQAYALWCGKRLPTAAEWEAAARSPDGRLYPWGALEDTPKSATPSYEVLVAAQNDHQDAQYQNYISGTRSVFEDSHAHPRGLSHLLSNGLELTATVMPHDPSQVIIKGAWWTSHPQHINLRTFFSYPRSESMLTLGFRCARSLSVNPFFNRNE